MLNGDFFEIVVVLLFRSGRTVVVVTKVVVLVAKAVVLVAKAVILVVVAAAAKETKGG